MEDKDFIIFPPCLPFSLQHTCTYFHTYMHIDFSSLPVKLCHNYMISVHTILRCNYIFFISHVILCFPCS